MPPIIAPARLALLASEGLATLGPVMGICSQAGQTIVGAGCQPGVSLRSVVGILAGFVFAPIRLEEQSPPGYEEVGFTDLVFARMILAQPYCWLPRPVANQARG